MRVPAFCAASAISSAGRTTGCSTAVGAAALSTVGASASHSAHVRTIGLHL